MPICASRSASPMVPAFIVSVIATAIGGTLFVIGSLTGSRTTIDVLPVMEKELRVHGNNTGPAGLGVTRVHLRSSACADRRPNVRDGGCGRMPTHASREAGSISSKSVSPSALDVPLREQVNGRFRKRSRSCGTTIVGRHRPATAERRSRVDSGTAANECAHVRSRPSSRQSAAAAPPRDTRRWHGRGVRSR